LVAACCRSSIPAIETGENRALPLIPLVCLTVGRLFGSNLRMFLGVAPVVCHHRHLGKETE
jgi:hypothetical protein